MEQPGITRTRAKGVYLPIYRQKSSRTRINTCGYPQEKHCSNIPELKLATFWRSTDYGKTWQELPNVNTGSMYVLGMKFTDALNGQMKLLDLGGHPSRNGLVVWTTTDGGYTWHESLRVLTQGISPYEKIVEAYAEAEGGRYGSHWGTCKYTSISGCQAFGGDGSEWNITSGEDSQSYIIQSISPDSTEETAHRFPIKFSYQNGSYIPIE